ncbi:timeless protein-domain-containing protein [Catenaria anguillulae PL171]|uniref:Timeless protein-domain-containing protein n=1 Tax=Catenaria anguillulae PL171 TaxID=765915 RepID=A0A1Y2I3T5_9FUNG|nr:timeless protein-domain-containing protein [Catenaria anguillulae PL171]
MADEHSTEPSPDAVAATQSATALLESHLLSLTAAIGGFEDSLAADGSLASRYVPGDECLECLRDVKRFLRYDEANEEKTVALLLGKWQLVQNHLVPIILTHSANQAILFAVIELLVPLTWPLQGEHLKTELLSQQRSYKQVVVESYAIDTLFQQLLMLLSVPVRQRNERTNAIVRLILYLFRNLLAIPDPAPGPNVTATTFQQSQMQETLVFKLHSLDALEFFVAASSNVGDREYASWNMILVEIFFLLFCTSNPRSLCRPVSESQADLLDSLLEKENTSRIAPRPRHSRFAANFTVVQGGNARLFVRGIEATVDAVNSAKQKNRPRSRFGKGDVSTTNAIESTLINAPTSVTNSEYAQLLRNLACSFLATAFDPLISSAKRDMDAERTHVRDEDPIQLMYLIQFFFEFQRLNHDTHNVNLLSSIANVHGMLFLIKNIRAAVDEQQPSRLHMALECLREFLLTAQLMRTSKDDDIKDLAVNILDNLYYERHHLDMFVQLFRAFKQQSWRHLVALVSVVHVMLKAMEMHISALGKESLTVRQAKRKGGRAAAGRKDGDAEELIAHDVEDPEPETESKEKQFVEKDMSFANVEALFCNDAVVDKYMLLLSRLAELTPDQVYAVTKMVYRIAVHREQYALFFQLHYLNMFHVVLHNKDVNRLVNQSKRKRSLSNSSSSARPLSSKHAVKKEPSSLAGSGHTAVSVVPKLVALLRLILNKFFACFEAYPLMGIDILFPHTKSDLERLVTGRLPAPSSSTRSGRARQEAGPPTWDSDVELEVRPGFSRKMEVQIAVSALLVREESRPVLDRLLATLTKLAQLRKRTKSGNDQDEAEPDVDRDGSVDQEQPFSDVMLSIPPSDITIKEMRLLVKSLGMHLIKLDGTPDAETGSVLESVVAPGSISGEDLDNMIAWIIDARDDPIKHNNKPAYKLLKAKRPRKPRRKKERQPDSDEDPDEEVPKKKRMSKKEANAKSAAFVYDSDEMLEGEDDSDFYKREDDRRERTKMLHEAMMKEKTPSVAVKDAAKTNKKAVAVRKSRKGASCQGSQSDADDSLPQSDTDADDESDGGAGMAERKLTFSRKLKRPQRPRRLLPSEDEDSDADAAQSADDDEDVGTIPLGDVAADDEDDSFAAKLAVLRAATQSIASSVPRSRLFAVISDDDDGESDGGPAGGSGTPPATKRARMDV